MLKENLKKYRRLKNYTQKELATKTGVSAGYVQMIELGKKNNPSIDLLQKIADALEVSINDLLGTSENFESDFNIETFDEEVKEYVIHIKKELKKFSSGTVTNTLILQNIIIDRIAEEFALKSLGMFPKKQLLLEFSMDKEGNMITGKELKNNLVEYYRQEYLDEKLNLLKSSFNDIAEYDNESLEETRKYYEDIPKYKIPRYILEKLYPEYLKATPEKAKFNEDMERNNLSFYSRIVEAALKEVLNGNELDELGLQAVKEYYKESSTEDIPEVFRKYFKK